MPTITEASLLKDFRTIIEAVRFDPRREIRRASVPVATSRTATGRNDYTYLWNRNKGSDHWMGRCPAVAIDKIVLFSHSPVIHRYRVRQQALEFPSEVSLLKSALIARPAV